MSSDRSHTLLRQSEERFSLFFRKSPIATSITSIASGRYLAVNEAWARMFGYAAEDVAGRTSFDLGIWPYPDERAKLVQMLHADASVHEMEATLSTRDGRSIDALLSAETMELNDERYLLMHVQDVTDHRRAQLSLRMSEEALRHSLSLVQATLESTADGILVVDRIGQITGYNRQFVKMWNIPQNVLQSQDDPLILSSIATQLKDPEGFMARVDHLYRTPEEDSFDLIEFADGRIFERYSRPQRINGSPVGRVWSFRDVTERRLLEQQLIQAQKLESLGTLAGGIAHDFNNLLAMILGSAELLRMQTGNNEKVQKYVDRIIDASARGKSISRQLLMFSRPMQAELNPVRLRTIVDELREMLSHFLPKSIAVERRILTADDCIMADSGQIHQALLNLAINAGDAMPEGGVLTIDVRSADAAEMQQTFGRLTTQAPYVAVSIRDTGCGMDEQTKSKIFDPFFTTKARSKGTGLGLSIIHGIVKSHKGFIGLESAPSMGTTFTLYFPIERRDAPEHPRDGVRRRR